MPTGYTAMIEEDNNLNAREFIKKCGRAFGMFSHQREDALDADLRYPELDTYYANCLDDAITELAGAEDWTVHEIAMYHRKYVDDILAQNYRSVARAKKINESYEAVLAKLDKWQPTDEINQKIKQYAIDQINMCYPATSYTVDPEVNQEVWYEGHMDHLTEQVNYYSQRVDEEHARFEDRTIAIANFLADLENIPE